MHRHLISTSAACLAGAFALGLLTGCARVPNLFAADSPSYRTPLESPTAADVQTRFVAPEPRSRQWQQRTVAAKRTDVLHGPLYFEDPFEDKGTGEPHQLGWGDALAAPYGFSRFTLNWLLAPASMIVTPPWTPLVSDGRLSRQALGYDHDALPAHHATNEPPAPAPADSL